MSDPELIGDYFRQVIASRLDAGELAVIYGHPERRLGRMPEIMSAIAAAVESRPLVWRASFSELARWWRWRGERRWLVIPREDERLEIQFDEWDTEYAFAIDIERGRFRVLGSRDGPADVAWAIAAWLSSGVICMGGGSIRLESGRGRFRSSERSRPRSTGRR